MRRGEGGGVERERERERERDRQRQRQAWKQSVYDRIMHQYSYCITDCGHDACHIVSQTAGMTCVICYESMI